MFIILKAVLDTQMLQRRMALKMSENEVTGIRTSGNEGQNWYEVIHPVIPFQLKSNTTLIDAIAKLDAMMEGHKIRVGVQVAILNPDNVFGKKSEETVVTDKID